MNSYEQSKQTILSELTRSLGAVEPAQTDVLIAEILQARKVFVVGVGRVLLMMQAFVKRLNHIGVEAYFVGEINEPAVTEDDLLIVGSGSGESAFPVTIAKVAGKYHPRMAYIGSNPNSTVAGLCDVMVRIPCRTKLALTDEIPSAQPMSSLFEQSLLLYLDTVCLMIVNQRGIVIADLWQKHANLE